MAIVVVTAMLQPQLSFFATRQVIAMHSLYLKIEIIKIIYYYLWPILSLASRSQLFNSLKKGHPIAIVGHRPTAPWYQSPRHPTVVHQWCYCRWSPRRCLSTPLPPCHTIIDHLPAVFTLSTPPPSSSLATSSSHPKW